MILQHRAIQGRWNEAPQRINDAAIINANFIVVLTPPGVPAEGTEREVRLARTFKVAVVEAPPGDDRAIELLLSFLRSVT